MKITTLKARSIRGIPKSWPDLPVGSKGLVIYGPNGVGKSSVVDAFEFALTRQSTLFPENRQGVSWEIAAPHIKTGPAEIAVELLDGFVKTEVGPTTDLSRLEPSVASWIKLAEGSNFVLRRHMLLRFINERPQDRYALLSPFCNLGSFQAIESSLLAWVERVETDRVAQETKITGPEQRLRQVFKLGVPSAVTETALLAQINSNLRDAGLAACSSSADMGERKSELEAAVGGKDRTDRVAALGGLKIQAQRLGRVLDLSEALNAFLSALRDL